MLSTVDVNVCCQLSSDSCQLSVDSCQLSLVSCNIVMVTESEVCISESSVGCQMIVTTQLSCCQNVIQVVVNISCKSSAVSYCVVRHQALSGVICLSSLSRSSLASCVSCAWFVILDKLPFHQKLGWISVALFPRIQNASPLNKKCIGYGVV